MNDTRSIIKALYLVFSLVFSQHRRRKWLSLALEAFQRQGSRPQSDRGRDGRVDRAGGRNEQAQDSGVLLAELIGRAQ